MPNGLGKLARLARLRTVVRNGITTTLFYNDAGLLNGGGYAGGTLANLALTNRYDNYLRRSTNGVTLSGSFVTSTTKGCFAVFRLAAVGDGTDSATYSYLANSPLVSQITFQQSGNTHMTTSKQTAEVFGCDPDGNMTNDGRWAFTWDAENRLVKLESLATGPGGSKRRLEFEYDHQGRRIRKTVTSLDTSTVSSETKFAYDGWSLLVEVNATSNTLLRSYVWGLDLSGSPQGAGGVGRLVVVNDTANGASFAVYDANGNVTPLAKASDGTTSAVYEYGPFGELLRASGTMARLCPIRFSTTYQDDGADYKAMFDCLINTRQVTQDRWAGGRL